MMNTIQTSVQNTTLNTTPRITINKEHVSNSIQKKVENTQNIQDKVKELKLNAEKNIKKSDDTNDFYVQKQIKTLAEKFEKYHIYTKDASKIVAEQIIKGAIEFLA